ncbi:energy-coupling factor transporter ATPase [Sporolactobacillus sp. CPB3-1]|uniref:Energy-coupling factor transporter ATP-binding protein EcfA2 n=1 Tax=Sporolactobacillus mangiferae TaxID=2940498 RepID=A0ABT0MDG6_9BACL|nr:energy-coupling factor transporter ATPase [Sporolactobacillus mangiferae]MCL1632909.1 energy-coupling factor transporter ATPase [Sporolactobacillus mangiferae]
MAIIELKHVHYAYGVGTSFEKQALNNISFSVDPGDFLAIVGHTGSGKSTLIRHLNGLLRPDSGQVFIHGKDLWSQMKDRRSVRFQIGLVFQYPETQLFEDTVGKDIAFGPKNMGLNEQEVKQRVQEALAFVGLDASYLERNPFRLSGGEMRRVAIAGVLAMRPSVLVLDEPTAGLDFDGRALILQQLEQFRIKSGAAIILVTHNMDDIAEHAQRVIVLHEGRMVLSGTTASVFSEADILKQCGLDVPQITRVLIKLKERGLPVRTDAITLEAAEREILKLFREGG